MNPRWRGVRLLQLVLPMMLVEACALPPERAGAQDSALGVGLPTGFLLGAGTSAHQIEGGSEDDWTDWEAGTFPGGEPHIKGGARSGRAVDAWELWRDDLQALEYLGANAYRLSIAWSRLQPGEDTWSAAAVQRYREMLGAMRARGITPLVTVQHFTLPRWVAARGGWEWPGIVDALGRFSERASAELGDLVDYWVTVNEPNAIVAASYQAGLWPPGVADKNRALHVYATVLRAHGRIAAGLRAGDTVDADGDGRATVVGLAHNIVLMQPASASPLDSVLAGFADDLVNEVVPRAVKQGVISIHVPGFDLDQPAPELVGTFDYLGINYYQRNYLRADLSRAILAQSYVPDDYPRSDMGWEIYADGLYQVLMRFKEYGWPMIITENGIADAADRQRPLYLRAHLRAMQRAIRDGADVRGYFHWTLMDNFEWAYGYSARMGLFAVDFDDPALKRVPRPSASVFQEAARGMGLHPKPWPQGEAPPGTTATAGQTSSNRGR